MPKLTKKCKRAIERWVYTSRKIGVLRYNVAKGTKAERALNRACKNQNLSKMIDYHVKMEKRKRVKPNLWRRR